jgi:hypothetical protein
LNKQRKKIEKGNIERRGGNKKRKNQQSRRGSAREKCAESKRCKALNIPNSSSAGLFVG